MTCYIGTSGWSYDHWKGRFYPDNLVKRRWLEYYASHFNAVEINATFYRRFKDDVYRKWRDQAPDDFHYVLKIPRLISHRHHLLNVETEIQEFERSCRLLQERFGLMLLQLPPSMPYEPERLRNTLLAVDDPTRIAIEFRHDRWITDETLSLLAEFNAIYCNPDEPDHALSTYLTGKAGYLRLHGNRQWYTDNYTQKELTRVASQVEKLISTGAKDLYIFFNNDYEAFAPLNASSLQQMVCR